MDKKYIITITILIIIAVISSSFSKNQSNIKTPVEQTSPRNDLVVNVSTSTQEVKSYSLAEVALHDKKSDCWLAIDGKVIDATQFIAEGKHPNDKIINGCGKDATAMFQSVGKHDGGKAQAALKQYEIGVLK